MISLNQPWAIRDLPIVKKILPTPDFLMLYEYKYNFEKSAHSPCEIWSKMISCEVRKVSP